MNNVTLNLFKALVIKKNDKTFNDDILLQMSKTIKYGFIFSPEIYNNFSAYEINFLTEEVISKFSLNENQMNSTLHKYWGKVANYNICQLIAEQVIHYISTYGFEFLGIYSNSTIYIPHEKLDIPELVKDINLIVINGYTEEEIKNKVMALLQSGIALKTEHVSGITDLLFNISIKEIETVKNKEVKIVLYDKFNVVPSNPLEFLRYIVFKATNSTLLIKDKKTIKLIKESPNTDIYNLFNKYEEEYGLEKLSEIFYRFKPLFLAFKREQNLESKSMCSAFKKVNYNLGINNTINKIRKLAIKNHKAMPTDYLNSITGMIKRNILINEDLLKFELKKVNVFRKIRLLYALKFRETDSKSIMYRIRNGKAFSTTFDFKNKEYAKKIYDIVFDSFIQDLSVKGKKIYIPDFVNYALPSTEKQFTGYFPSGTYVSIPKDMVFGVHWDDVEYNRIDLDLSLVSISGEKYGWDARWRDDNGNVLFSGDVTAAPQPNGASELFYINKQHVSKYAMCLNYYNFEDCREVPYQIMIAQKQIDTLNKNYMIDPNDLIVKSNSVTKNQQKILGFVNISKNKCKFYFAETSIGNSIISSDKDYMKQGLDYLYNFYADSIYMKDVLIKAGAIIVDDNKECDIDLSPEKIDKSTFIDLLKKN